MPDDPNPVAHDAAARADADAEKARRGVLARFGAKLRNACANRAMQTWVETIAMWRWQRATMERCRARMMRRLNELRREKRADAALDEDAPEAAAPTADAPADGRQLAPSATLSGHAGAVYTVAFAPSGRLLASGSYDTLCACFCRLSETEMIASAMTERMTPTINKPPVDGPVPCSGHGRPPIVIVGNCAQLRRPRTSDQPPIGRGTRPSFDESISTLRFAHRAKQVALKATQ